MTLDDPDTDAYALLLESLSHADATRRLTEAAAEIADAAGRRY